MTKYWRYKRRNYILAYGLKAWQALIARKKRKRYNQTPRGRFTRQKINARRRGIEWLLTFDEWWQIWECSGRWKQRGSKAGNFQMARKRDQGPYAFDNVVIVKLETNAYAVLLSSRCTRFNKNSRYATEVATIL